MSNSIADIARTNILTALALSEPQGSNVDLMVLLHANGLQVTWTFSTANDAVNYWNYESSLR